MKPLPAPYVPGDTPWQRLDSAVRQVFSVSKETLNKEEAKRKRGRARKKTSRKSK